jgi:hypothetical protein
MNPVGVVTLLSSACQTLVSMSPTRLRGATSFCMNRAHSSRTPITISGSACSKPSRELSSPSPATCSSTKRMSSSGAV